MACPPAKNFTDQYIKTNQTNQTQSLSSKPSTSNFQTVGKKESEKDLAQKATITKENPVSRN